MLDPVMEDTESEASRLSGIYRESCGEDWHR
jgi:hypothetical protein